jgi:hypothetical protein
MYYLMKKLISPDFKETGLNYSRSFENNSSLF